MDLKSKGISWAGNFYQKFEKVCHEVDNIVNQEAVKYVENQVQSVGKNMKKFYSNVITDVLHPLMDPVKHDVQEKPLEKNAAIHSHIESEMGIDKNHVDKENENSHFEPSEFDPLEAANFDEAPIQIADAFTDGNSKLKFEESTAMEKPCLDEGSEFTSPGKEEFFGDSLQCEFVACNGKISQEFPDEITVVTSAPREKCQSNDNVITFPNSFVDDSKCVSDSSSATKSTEIMSSVVASEKNMVDAVDLRSRSPLRETFLLEISNENAPARALSCHSHVDVDGFISHTELPSSLSTTTFSSENKVSEMGLISSSTILSSESIDSLSALRSTEMTGSVVSSEESIVDAADFSSRFPLRESILLENSNNNSHGRVISCHSSVDVAGFVSHDVLQSSLSTTTLSSENKGSETGLISSSIVVSSELIDSLSTLRSIEMTSSVVSSKENVVDAVDISTMSPLRGSFLLDNSNENSPPSEASCHSMVDVAGFISQTVLPFPSSLSSATLSSEKMVSETGLISSSSVPSLELIDDSNDADNVSSMETIDLCDQAKLEDSCVYVDNSALYAVSHTLRKHRSCKQMLQDAFTAKKRLVKEYKQLAIWFGDADMGSDKESLPSTAATTMGYGNSQTELEGDSGWELL
ncbi:hypothetical protein SLE2022_344080 [Rubroshorea leprosula]